MRRFSSTWCGIAAAQVVNPKDPSDQKRFFLPALYVVWCYHFIWAEKWHLTHTNEISALRQQVNDLSKQVLELNKRNNANPSKASTKNDSNDKKETPVIHQEGPKGPGL